MENELSEDDKKIELKIQFLQENLKDENIFFEIKKMPYDKTSEYQIIFSIKFKDEKNEEKNAEFLLLLNLTKKKIYLFSLNLVEISDGRDLLPFIIHTKTNHFNIDELNLLTLIENIKIFISTLTNKNLIKIGRFYLGEEYDINFISTLKGVFIKRCFHYDVIDGNYINIPSLITISDDYLCLYEYIFEPNKQIKDIKNKFLLVFYGNIKSIISFKKSLYGEVVTIAFRREYNNKMLNLKISGNEEEDMDKIMNVLIEKIKNIGYRLDIYEKKLGQLPKINIVDTEKNISLYEEKLNNGENTNDLKQLLSLYEQAIEFYSAINDKRYIEYNNKISKLLKNPKYSELLK